MPFVFFTFSNSSERSLDCDLQVPCIRSACSRAFATARLSRVTLKATYPVKRSEGVTH
jgi:hypothetical protein